MKSVVKDHVFLCGGACTFFILELVLALSVHVFAHLEAPHLRPCVSHDSHPGPDVTPAPLLFPAFLFPALYDELIGLLVKGPTPTPIRPASKIL